jgi:2-oxoisovalerate dehydrogenase E2 component (dihydrolipoyl transacylase)
MIRGAELGKVQPGDEVKRITGIKKAMTKSMTQALTIPTFTFQDDMDATKLIKLRNELKSHVEGITFLPFFVKAISLAMQEFPILNSVVNPETDSEGLI